MNALKIVILSKDIRYIAGVANFVRIMMENYKKIYDNNIKLILFVQGRYYEKWKNYFLPILYPYQYLKFLKIIKKEKPELIHLNPSMGPTAMWRDGLYLRIAKKRKIPVLFFIHGWDNSYFENAVKRGFFSKFHRKTLLMADAIVVLSPEFKKKLINIGVPKEKIFVLSTMVETENYIPESKNFREPYNILFCSRIEKEKGIYETLESIKIISEKYPKIKLHIMGSGNEINNVKEYVKTNKLKDKVILLGYVDERKKYEVYKKSHVFIFPTYYGEGFPTVILEAMASGLVIITTPVGGVKYSFRDGYNGFLLSTMPPDPREIAEKIEYILRNPDLAEKISRNNMNESMEKYDVKIVMKKISMIYEKICNTIYAVKKEG